MVSVMPVIYRSGSLVLIIYYQDHNPPHFHAKYQGSKAVFLISTGACTDGGLPGPQLREVERLAAARRQELLDAWDRAQGDPPQPPGQITPLP